MALTLAIVPGVNGASARADRPINYNITVTNTGSAAVTLQSLSVGAAGTGTVVGQPNYLTPNVPVGLGNPIIAASSSATYSFQAVFHSPYFPGPSPQNPGGAAAFSGAMTPDPYVTLQAQAQSSDGSIASTLYLVPVLSPMYPFPIPEGGGLILTQGSNLMTLTMFGAL